MGEETIRGTPRVHLAQGDETIGVGVGAGVPGACGVRGIALPVVLRWLRVTDASASAYRPTTVVDYVAILRRRKWIVIVPVLVAGLSAFFVSSRQEPEYRANAEILVDTTNLPSDPERFMKTLARISRSPQLARQVAAELPGMTPEAVLDQTAVMPSAGADFLSVTATDSREAMAVRLANTFASQVSKFTEEFVAAANRSSKD